MLQATSLQMCDLGYRRSCHSVLGGLSACCRSGELIALLGANGAGKTTLLRLLLGLVTPSSGRVLLGGRDLRHVSRGERARQMAYVPQIRGKPPAYTVAQVVSQGRLAHGSIMRHLTMSEEAEVETILTCLRLETLRDRPCSTLSGGEYQRVLLARALVQETGILVLDEPLAGLDYGHQLRFLAQLNSLAQGGRLVIFSAHQPDLVYRHATRVMLLEAGCLYADGSPAVVLNASLIGPFYDMALKQVEHGLHRFFYTED